MKLFLNDGSEIWKKNRKYLQSNKTLNHGTIVAFEANKQINNAQDQTDDVECDCANK